LIQASRYNQVLTGILLYHGSCTNDTFTRIHAGERPSRPIDSSKSRLLEDPVWNVITTGWHDQPNRRCELSVMYHTFSPFGQQEIQNLKPGDVNAQPEGKLTIAETSQTAKRQPGKILPRIASFFQFLQNSESEPQKRVNEMNEVSFSTSPPRLIRKVNTSCSGLRTTSCQIGSD